MQSEPVYLHTNDFALIIGVRDYPNFGNLQGPIEDANAFYQWLTDPQKGSIPPSHCELVTSVIDHSNEYPERPLQHQIDQAFHRIWKQLSSSEEPARRFYFFFNGHGIGSKQSNTALLMANFELSFFRDSALSSAEYLDRIVSSGKFQEVIFLLDCCRNQQLNVNGLPPTFRWPKDHANTGSTAIWVGYAAEYQSMAYESEVLDELERRADQDGSLFRGHFTHALLKGLDGAAAHPVSGRITPDTLKVFIEKETPRIAKQNQRNQRAKVTNEIPSDRQVYFGVTVFNQQNAYRINLKASHTGNVTLLDGQAQVVKSKDVDPLPWEVSLPAGLYMLVDEVTQEEKTIRVQAPFITDTHSITF